MPNCFTLTRKSNLEAGPVKFVEIDAELCKHFNEPVDEVHWYLGWYDSIGLGLALGKSWDELRTWWKEEDAAQMLRIIDYLEENFTPNAWYQYGR